MNGAKRVFNSVRSFSTLAAIATIIISGLLNLFNFGENLGWQVGLAVIALAIGIPLEEFLFFLIVPMAAIMTIEGVRSVKKHWPVGDEKQ